MNKLKYNNLNFLGQSLAVTLPWSFIPILYFLANNAYPWLHLETIIIYIIFVFFGLFLAFWRYLLRSLWQSIFDATLVSVVLSFLAVHPPMQFLPITFANLAIFFLFLDKKSWLLLSWCAIGFLVGQALVPKKVEHILGSQRNVHTATASIAPKQNHLPVVIHLIMDEHAGIVELNQTDPKHQRGSDVLQFYQQNGFQVYPNAYSRYSNTINSIPSLLNFTDDTVHGYYLLNQDHDAVNGGELTVNRYFSLLYKQGYRIRVYQPVFIGYCEATVPIDQCNTAPTLFASTIANLPMPVYEKFVYLITAFLDRSAIVSQLKETYFTHIRALFLHFGYDPSWPNYTIRATTVSALSVMDKIEEAIIREHDGIAYFAHILWPHSPYVYKENCTLKIDVRQWKSNIDPPPIANTQTSFKEKQKQYHEQVGCVTYRLGQFFDRLKKQGIYDRAIIIVHGDHGSRILYHSPDIVNKNELIPQDYLYAFGTLFAYKAPFTLSASPQAIIPITSLFNDLVSQWLEVKLPRQSSENFVYLVPAQAGEMLLPEPLDQTLWFDKKLKNTIGQYNG